MNWFTKWFRKTPIAQVIENPAADEQYSLFDAFTTTSRPSRFAKAIGRETMMLQANERVFLRNADSFVVADSGGMDAVIDLTGIKAAFQIQAANITDQQMAFFTAHSFIGFQMCAVISQNWLVSKICSQPAADAVRHGYELTVNDGSKVDPKILHFIKQRDKDMKVNANLREFVYFGRMFGIRIAMFDIESPDGDEFYKNPFNPDGITEGSYKGIIQIDPYWITPELGEKSASEPGSMTFMEPTWWRVQGRRIHRSHLIIMRGPEVADVLKPSYVFAGMSIPQMIYERCYCAERTANEAPQLAASKREMIYKVDLKKTMANQSMFEDVITWINAARSNFSIRAIGKDEEVDQIDTSLTGLDETINKQYELACAVGGVPVSKILGTSPKGGLGSEGVFDDDSYDEELEGIQQLHFTPLIDRHHLCLMRSDVMPKFNLSEPINLVVEWTPLDVVSHLDQAKINLLKAQTGAQLVANGAILGDVERERIIADPSSGYNRLEAMTGPPPPPVKAEPVHKLDDNFRV